MNLFKINSILQRLTVILILVLAVLRILHMIPMTLFLWSALAAMIISWIVSQRTVEKLQDRLQELEGNPGK